MIIKDLKQDCIRVNGITPVPEENWKQATGRVNLPVEILEKIISGCVIDVTRVINYKDKEPVVKYRIIETREVLSTKVQSWCKTGFVKVIRTFTDGSLVVFQANIESPFFDMEVDASKSETTEEVDFVYDKANPNTCIKKVYSVSWSTVRPKSGMYEVSFKGSTISLDLDFEWKNNFERVLISKEKKGVSFNELGNIVYCEGVKVYPEQSYCDGYAKRR